MESSRRLQLLGGIIAAILLCTTVLHGEKALPLFGTWKLNLAQSKYDAGAPPYKRSTCRIETLSDGIRIVYDMVGIRGGITHLEWDGKLDGQDYPIQGIDEVLTNAYTQIDDRNYDIVIKADGKRAAFAHISISPDGKSLTTITTSRNGEGKEVRSTVIYDRQ